MALNRESIIRNAEKYVSKGKLEAAIKEYRKVLAENPNDANTLNRVGDLYARIERFGEAVKLFSQIADQYTQDGFFVKAIAIYKKIIKLDPTALTVYERLAELYYKQGLLTEARTQYQVLADYYQKHDNAASAISIYQKMSQMEPENPAFHLKLAELYASQRLDEKALREYRTLADLLIVNGSVEEATQVYLKALEVSNGDLDFIRDAVTELHEGGHVGAAANLLSRAVELNPQAAGLAEEIGLSTSPSAAPVATPRPPASDAAARVSEFSDADTFDLGDMADAGGFDTGFGGDDTFEVPETSFADFDSFGQGNFGVEPESLGGGGAAAADDPFATEEEEEVFTLDLDDDEVPASLVSPPPDMLDEPLARGGAHRAAPPSAAEEDEEEATLHTFPADGDDASFADFTFDDEPEIELADEEEDAGEETRDVLTDEPEIEVEWSMGGLDDLDVAMTVGDVDEDADLDGSATVFAEPEHPPAAERQGGLAPFEPEDFDDSFPPSAFEVGFEAEESHAATAAATAEEVELELEPAVVDAEAEEAEAVEDEAPTVLRREEDLLAEAQVFAKYGLKEKAQDRLSELFTLRPEHLGGLRLQTRLHLDAGRHQEVVDTAREVARLAAAQGDLTPWNELQEELTKAGFTMAGEEVVHEPAARTAEDDRIAQLLEDLSLEDFDTPATGRRLPGAASPDEDETVVVSRPAGAAAAAAAPPRTSAGAPAGGKKLISLADELGLDDLDDELEELGLPHAAAAEPVEVSYPSPANAGGGSAGAPGASAGTVDALDETGMSWLDDVQTPAAGAGKPVETIFDEEDDFFDLAAELERELSQDELTDDTFIPQPQEQSLEDIIEGFKQGVAENLSPEDYDTHFNLGIAYREMGLLDEAIGEFQLASKDDRYLVDCSSLLGLCFLDKGLPELAVRWYRKGLESPHIREEATMGLLYDMGNAYLSLGDADAAYKTFVEIYGLNSNYRDVSSKLQELRG